MFTVKLLNSCAKEAVSDLQPVVKKFIETAGTAAALINKCAPSAASGPALAICAVLNLDSLIKLAKDMEETVNTVQNTYNSLRPKMEDCKIKLQSNTDQIRDLVNGCVDQ